jgi:hypothetical protein
MRVQIMRLLECAVWLAMATETNALDYVVDQRSAKASDANAGTETVPLATIAGAVRKVKPGDGILVKNGTYRETVSPPAGTAGRPITLKAWPGHRPVVKGSEVVKGPWKPGEKRGIYTTAFEPYTQMVFVDERPLQQIGQFERIGPDALNKIKFEGKGPEDLRPGTFFYDKNQKRLYIWLVDSDDPAGHQIEAAVRYDGVKAKSHTYVGGLDVRHCQAGPGKGEAGILVEGEDVTIESCRSTYNDFSGLILSGSDCVVRNCELAWNGNDGLTSCTGARMLLEGNTTHHNNTRHYDPGWHAGGMKIVQWTDSRVIRHRAYAESVGLWFDVSVRNMLVADSLFENCLVGVYYEISRWGVLVNNVCRDCDCGLWSYSSDVLIAHNVTDRCARGIVVTGAIRYGEYSTKPSENHNCLTATRNNLIINNIIIDAVDAYIGIEKDSPHNGPNYSDYNVFVWTLPAVSGNGNHIKFMSSWDTYYGRLAIWELAGYDQHSMVSDGNLYRLIRSRRNIYDMGASRVLPDAVFADRVNGKYDLPTDSPMRKLGRQVPLKLKSVYKPGRRPWETTLIEDAPDSKAAKVLFEAGGRHYRAQPEPKPLMMFDPDKMSPADPGLNRCWTEANQYPSFQGTLK